KCSDVQVGPTDPPLLPTQHGLSPSRGRAIFPERSARGKLRRKEQTHATAATARRLHARGNLKGGDVPPGRSTRGSRRLGSHFSRRHGLARSQRTPARRYGRRHFLL